MRTVADNRVTVYLTPEYKKRLEMIYPNESSYGEAIRRLIRESGMVYSELDEFFNWLEKKEDFYLESSVNGKTVGKVTLAAIIAAFVKYRKGKLKY